MGANRLSEKAVLNLQAAAVLVFFGVMMWFVPHQWLRPLSIGYAALAGLALVGIRAYLRRLESVVEYFAANPNASPAEPLGALLTRGELTLLRLGPQGTAAGVTDVVRRRQAALFRVGMGAGILLVGSLLMITVLFESS